MGRRNKQVGFDWVINCFLVGLCNSNKKRRETHKNVARHTKTLREGERAVLWLSHRSGTYSTYMRAYTGYIIKEDTEGGYTGIVRRGMGMRNADKRETVMDRA